MRRNKAEGETVSVITIPLKLRPYEADTLDSRFRVCCSIYNAMLGGRLKAYEEMCQIPEYAEAKAITDAVLKNDGTPMETRYAKELRDTGKFKKALAAQAPYHKEYGFSEFSFMSMIASYRNHFKDIIPSMMAALSIAKPMWSAFDKLLYKEGKNCSFKKARDFSSIATDGKSGMRIVDDKGATIKTLEPGGKYWISMTSNKGRQLLIAVKPDEKDHYIMDMMNRDIKIVRIVRKRIKERFAYSLQLTLSGAPAVKYNSNGDPVHPIGKGRISIFADEQYFTIADEKGNITEMDISFPESSEYIEKKKELQQKMDESKRISNPQNVNPDGTFMRRKDNSGKRLKWTFSKSYRHYASEKANLDRKQAESRVIRASIIANNILAMGDDFSVNDRSFKTNVGGKKYKDSIANNAPYQILDILNRKLKSAGLGGLHKYKLPVDKNDKHKDGYRKKYAKKLLQVRLQDLGEAK